MLDPARYEVLTCDCYGTLINWEDGILRCLHHILSAHSRDADDPTLLQMYGDFEASAEQGDYRSYRENLKSVVRQFGNEFGFAPTELEAASLPDSIRDWNPWPDRVGALRSLRKCFRLAIISNADDDLFAATQPKLEVDFDQIITAQQARSYKPSLKIFELASTHLGVPAHRILHVGQSVYHDVIPAQSLGLSTVWVNRPSARNGVGAVKAAEGHPDLKVSSLEELAEALAKS
jgi:2-haloacid dehalogenase